MKARHQFRALSRFETLERRRLLAFAANVNFQPADVPVPGGYLVDHGLTYRTQNGMNYGWDADNTATSRDRDASNSPDQRYDTLLHLQKSANRTWEISVPSGTYDVFVAAGDATYVDSVFQLNVEGQLTVSGTPASSNPWLEGANSVSVSDGRLTITSASGASNNKINFINITQTAEDPQPPSPAGVTDPSKPFPPQAPYGLSAGSPTTSSLQINWVDNTVRELGYKIERSTDGSNFSQLTTTGANVSSYVDTGLTSGAKYWYRVRAYNEYGNSSYSNIASATTLSDPVGGGGGGGGGGTTDPSKPYPPQAPYGLSASVASSSSIALVWVDNTVRELGYKIERSTNGTNFVQIDTTGQNINNYTDSSASPGIKYYYRVRAYNEYGNSSYTNTASATISDPNGPFQPKALSWSTKTSAPLQREESQSIVYNGKLYSIGGYVTGYNASREVDVYDPVTNKWSKKNDMPSGFADTHAAVAKDPDGHTFWFIGGFVGDFQHPPGGPVGPPATELVYKYDAATDTWTQGPSLPEAHGGGGAGIINGKLYFFGGSDITRTQDLDATYMLDLSNINAGWTRVATMLNPRNHVGGIVAGGYLYAIGGQHGIEESAVAQSQVDRFDPSNNTWTTVASLPMAESHFNAAEVLYDRYIITLGGESAHGVSQPWVFAYDTMKNQWAQMTNLPEARRAGIAGLVGTKLIFASGYVQSRALTSTTWTTDLTGIFT